MQASVDHCNVLLKSHLYYHYFIVLLNNGIFIRIAVQFHQGLPTFPHLLCCVEQNGPQNNHYWNSYGSDFIKKMCSLNNVSGYLQHCAVYEK